MIYLYVSYIFFGILMLFAGINGITEILDPSPTTMEKKQNIKLECFQYTNDKGETVLSVTAKNKE